MGSLQLATFAEASLQDQKWNKKMKQNNSYKNTQ